MKKHILGLDLGTNSIGWALVEVDENNKPCSIEGMGSRIIPMSQDILGNFESGNSISQTAERTAYRGTRRLRERHLLRRERLHRVLNVLGFLPEHYMNQIDFEKHLGKFFTDLEPKLAWKENANGKYEFIFQSSFNEMVSEFKKAQPYLFENGKLIPYDWTIYYLRKKALSQKIKKEELAWILLNFNQKRGYYQLRDEVDEENPNKLVEFHSLKVIDVVPDESANSKGETWYSLHLENGWIYRRSSKTPLFDWKDKVRDFIVTTDLNDDGTIKTDKEGNVRRSFRAPAEDDWTLLKKKTEADIDKSKKTVGTYIYDALLENPSQKIKGKLVRTIERKFYKEELKQILQKQQEFHPELQDEDLYNEAVRELYRSNESHQLALGKRDFTHLFLEDIIFYQRPLRSKKSSIGNCSLEYRKYRDKEGVEHIEYLKAAPKSNPYYQEFRLWQWLYNLTIYRRDDDTNVTQEFLNSVEDYENLFDFLDNRKEIRQDTLIKFLLEQKGFKGKMLANEASKYRWNFVDDKEKVYPCNETKALIVSRLAKVENLPDGFLKRETEQQLWHIIYSVTDKDEYEKALKSFAERHGLDVASFVENFKKFPPFKSEYGSFSEKAIKKLLPLMRTGKYWYWEKIDESTKKRIAKILTGEYDENIKERVREKAIHLTEEGHFQGLQLWLASYIVYGRHSEPGIAGKWNSVNDLEKYLHEFKQHSLRNPIVEQIVTEALRVIRDIWAHYGNGVKDFFSEIHIELGRQMKLPAEDRKKLSDQVLENERTNLRIKALLAEMLHYPEVENVRPYSPMQQEALKIFEDGVLSSNIEIDDDILKISKTAQPSSSELRRYKLWLEQKYRSPYTGQVIPLNRLFTADYEIEHIIPQSRYFDDSFNNKVICESAVNKLKDNQTSFEFIKNHHSEIVEVGFGKTVRIFEEEEYQKFVKEHYAKNRSKRNKLLMDEIPEKMIERQMNDTRYISKFISSILSNIVRSETNDDGINSKNIVPLNGKITGRLKQDWGLNDVWNDLILPRFERMNELTGSKGFTVYNERYQKYLPTVPLEFAKNFQKKRIDHRHHAMDALVIACATRDHVNFLNNQHALDKKKTKEEKDKSRFDLRNKLCFKNKGDDKGNYNWQFYKPWDNFTVDARNELEKIIVSFKQNLRVINKSVNYYQRFVDGKKVIDKQTGGENWAIRKPLHKDTVSGLVRLRKTKTVSLNAALDNYLDIVDKALRKHIISLVNQNYDKKKLVKYFKERENQWNGIDITKVAICYWDNDNVASRVNLDTSFNEKRIIETITDTGIQQILLNHLENYKGRLDDKGKEIAPESLAFTPEGIDEMNKNIVSLNNGKFHQPIFKVRTYEPKGNKFNVGYVGNKKTKYVEAAKGTNLFFAIYADDEGKRSYETIPLNIVIERLKQGLKEVPERNEKGHNLLFSLSPNDLVYVPGEEELTTSLNHQLDRNRIYKMVSSSGNQCFFVKSEVANPIVNKVEYSVLNKMEKSIDGIMIKQVCRKLQVDRLGNIQFA
jgi:CRISPR-associated endonuclease Csn1